ncbi:tripeptidyl-peptidase II Tpp2 [Phytophthora pseudosyringae]|uniref:tripeptidyl-peptidase II n=1 Tax=Phytophthora pseudosyringae TaxID=221518 RepID=A0A8T1WBE6_9STRA|nr:tripeptidyl-peptidase II Tpp2 [Phytophthora pseudosyringae]
MKSFPTASLLPKEETLADRFLQQYPDCDGRNAVVAIFDTGVDPGAIGLQTTPDGRPKVIDVVDATGAGDIDTSTVVESTDGQLALANGRVLTLNPAWKASPDGKYHVGTVAGFHLFPGPLVARLKTERREEFDIEQRAAANEVQGLLAKWGKENSATTDDTAKLRQRKDLQARAKQLEELAKSYEDPGPIYDAVVFHDGACWRAALDTKGSGDFTGVPALTNFKDELQYATFSDKSQLNYVLNIYDEGNTLSVVNDVGAHGTHVAGIVAAYYPEQPECNGVAPGAQIVAVKIGDGRLGSMETSSALSRAILAVMDANVDVVNMSYGEYASQHNYGRIVELSNKLVDEHNVTFVVSAGNNGPALGTVGAPGGTTSSMLSVGAYVSPKMMEGEYIMRDNDLSGIAYTWSSRGPTFDGDLGVNICAPGAAIAPVPNWTLNKKQLMNGTSMSSPNCAGNIALLVSAMKAQSIEYTPYSIRRALENTAVKVPGVEVYAQGKGLIQVLPAFEYLAASNKFDGTKQFPLHYEIKTSSGEGNARGIFLRDSADFAHDSTEVNVTVTPIFHKKAVQDDKVHFEQHVRLVPSARWIDVGRSLALMHGGRAFKVLVEAKHLAAGEHYGEIVAYDTQNDARGALFTIPVIVIKPEDAASTVIYQKKFQPGDISRRFITPPQGATWADIIFSRASGNGEREVESNSSGKLYIFDALQFQPFVRQNLSSCHKAFFLKPGQELAFSMDLLGSLTTEFCLGQFWSALGDSIVQVEIRFHGIKPDQEKIVVTGGEESHKVLVSSSVETETLAPKISFTKYVQHIRPKTAEISPLSSSRDQFPDKRQVYQLILTYPFTKKEAGKVVPRLPLLNGRLYESPFEAQLMMIFDDKKQYMGCSDAYGDETTLKKGSYVVRAQIRHEDVSKLEKLKQMMLVLNHDVKEIPASVYGHQDDVALGGKAIDKKSLSTGKYLSLFIGEPAYDKLPAGNAVGDVLTGKIHFGQKDGAIKGSSRRPGGFDITYVIPPAPTPVKDPEPEEPKDERDEEEIAKEAVRDLLLERTTKLVGKPTFLPAWQRLVDQFPNHLPAMQAKLHHFDFEADRSTQLAEVVEAADAVLALIKQDELALFFGTRSVPGEQPAAEKKLRKEKEREKSILSDALGRKARALGDSAQWEDFLLAYADLQKWEDVEASAYLHVSLLHDRHFSAFGLALQRLRKVQDMEQADKTKIISDATLATEVASTLDALSWKHWATYEAQWERRRAPTSYRIF